MNAPKSPVTGDGICDDQRHQQQADHPGNPRKRSQGEEPQRDATQHTKPQPERGDAERHDLGDVPAIDAPEGIEAVTHRAGTKQGKPDVIAEHITHEGCEAHVPVRKTPSYGTHGKDVIPGKHQVIASGKQRCEHQRPCRIRRENTHDIMVMILPKRACKQVQRQRKHHQHAERFQPVPHTSHAA